MNATVARKRTGVFILECGGRTFRADQPTLGFWVTETDSDGTILQGGYCNTAVTLDEAREIAEEMGYDQA